MGFILPYGYRMVEGETLVDPEKAAIIGQVFTKYIGGMSYEKIANSFPDELFDKHKVKRILENGKYDGTKGYPQVVEEALLQTVRELQAKRTQHYTPVPASIIAIRRKVFCDVCGGRYTRETKAKKQERWRCKNGCGPSILFHDEILINRIHHLQGKITDLCMQGPVVANERVPSEHKHNSKWNEPFDDKAVYQQIIESAILACNQCPDEYVNRKWRQIQSHQSGRSKGCWDIDLFHLAVEKVIITADAAIQLHLYTGNILK